VTPIKMMFVIRRKPGISHSEFREYYEANHVPLCTSLLPPVEFYRRNYVIDGTTFGTIGFETGSFPYDVLTELGFADRKAYEDFLEVAGRPEISARIAADEEQFMDRASVALFLVDQNK
jgi:uncharacterized protein (TIGR02118 family)